MRNNVVGRFEPLDDLKPAWLLHKHTLARIVRVTNSDHKPIRHFPNELALVKRDRHKLPAARIQAFAEEIQPSLFTTPFESPFVHLLAQGLDQRCLALELPFRICFHNSLPPCSGTTNPANRRYMVKPRRQAEHGEIVGPTPRLRPAPSGNKGSYGFRARGVPDRRISSSPRIAARYREFPSARASHGRRK